MRARKHCENQTVVLEEKADATEIGPISGVDGIGVECELEAKVEGCDIAPIVDIRRHTLTSARKLVLLSIPL